MKRVPPEICAICKGARKLCGASICPILVKHSYLIDKRSIFKKKNFDTFSPPSILVGEYGYPIVNVGPVSTINLMEKNKTLIEDPSNWARKHLGLVDILKIRLSTIFSFDKKRVTYVREKEDIIKDVAISLRPVDLELSLKKEPRIRIRLDADIPPVAATAPLERAEVTSNPITTRKIENAIEENVKTNIIVPELYMYGYSFYYIQRIFSAGLLGVKSRRKLVPTRWSITAVDSILGKYFLDHIKHYAPLGEAELYYWEYLGNKYYLLLIPSRFWSMELFEVWLPNSVWVKYGSRPIIIRNHESYDGKPIKMDGGYYAIRTGVLEHLFNRKRKAALLAIRIVTPRYFAPVGSWQIRESVKLALASGLIRKGEVEELIKLIEEREKHSLRIDIIRESWLLKRLKTLTLDAFQI